MTVLYSDIIRSTIASMNDVASLIDSGAVINGGTSGGSANAQTITTSPTVTTLSSSLRVAFIVGFTNTTTTPTMNVNSTSAVIVKRFDGTALVAGDLLAAAVAEIMYNGTNWLLINPSPSETTWAPGLGTQNGTVSGISYSNQNYIREGRWVTISLSGSATQNTSASNYLTAVLPITPTATNQVFAAAVGVTTGALTGGYAYISSVAGNGTIQIFHYANTQYSAANTVSFMVAGRYKIA